MPDSHERAELPQQERSQVEQADSQYGLGRNQFRNVTPFVVSQFMSENDRDLFVRKSLQESIAEEDPARPAQAGQCRIRRSTLSAEIKLKDSPDFRAGMTRQFGELPLQGIIDDRPSFEKDRQQDDGSQPACNQQEYEKPQARP